MPTQRINELLTSLSFDKKLIGVGSIFMIISLFMPWYQDRDTFNTGDMFFGMTGPLYLAGFSILVLAGFNIAYVIFDALKRKMPLLSIRPSSFFLFAGLASFYILLIVNSVYFHPKFGFNINMKQSDFGMFFAFISASLITIGGYLSGRNKVSLLKDFQQEAEAVPEQRTHEPLVKIPTQEVRKPKENLRTPMTSTSQSPTTQTQIVQPEEAAKPAPQVYRMDL